MIACENTINQNSYITCVLLKKGEDILWTLTSHIQMRHYPGIPGVARTGSAQTMPLSNAGRSLPRIDLKTDTDPEMYDLKIWFLQKHVY
jgi:hypothetical protein